MTTTKKKAGFTPEIIRNEGEIQKHSWLDDPFFEEIGNRLETEKDLHPERNGDEDIDEGFEFLWKMMERSGDVKDGRIVDADTRDKIKRVK